MKIPRWAMVGLCIAMSSTVLITIVAWWLSRPPVDLTGQWHGAGWGTVELARRDDWLYEGTYSSTFRRDVGRVKLIWSPQSRRYEGTWGEGNYRFGRVSLWLSANGTMQGEYSADPSCLIEPGDPIRQSFTWTKGRANDTLGVWSFR